MPKNEVQLSPNDPFSIFGPPIKTSKIPLVSKTSSKQQISDKAPPPQEKQVMNVVDFPFNVRDFPPSPPCCDVGGQVVGYRYFPRI